MESIAENKKTEQTMTDNESSDRKKGVVRENLEAIAIALLLALFIRAFLVQPFKIPSGSMEDTLLIGDRIFVCKFSYGVRLPFSNKVMIPVGEPERGDIVVFKYPRDPDLDFIKRVIGLPGDEVRLVNGRIFINGKRWEDKAGHYNGPDKPFAGLPARNFGPIMVPDGNYFVMGDNRDNSNDSRGWGFVPFDNLRGKAKIIYYSRDKHPFDIRWSRTGQVLR